MRVGLREIPQEGSTITQIDDAATSEPDVQRQRVRRRRPQKKRSRWLTFTGYGMILAGVAVLAWVAWQFWGTNWVSERRQDEVAGQLEDGWADGSDTVTTDFGRASAILHVPRWGDDYAVPVLEGSSDEVLAAGIGHMEDTAGPGEVGNYVLAGHRVTHGEPFAGFPELEEGDEVIVETRTATYVYELDFDGTDLEVPFTEDWVLQPFPENPDGGIQPPGNVGKELITLVSCAEIFHTEQRSVVFGHLVSTDPVER
ncbi:class E sortase [Nocardioides bizhenqiangii]|uniref:Class E sortase n=1 Tax=Nocardioides bizhenqiangii TaxID=3095076 RepID=A0ABZ0ZMQ8_9ACTN|nr:class E sortase [Nocardioides sp. HM61]WQQ25503.1 class E sortase [Nocardioides sp. HM61]